MSIIKAVDIEKNYGNISALKNINFEVEEGEIFGFIGPDGAGKTSLFRIITTLLLADKGEITVNGLNVVTDFKKIRMEIGYMPGRFSLYQDLSVEENLKFFATIFGTTIEQNYHLIKDIYSQIEPFKKRLAGRLSGGMKQKLALSCALIHKPKILVLDEPTTGVDAVSRAEFWNMLRNLKKDGLTIIVSTPYMDEAGLCDRIALIHEGVITQIGTPAEIRETFQNPLYAIKGGNKFELLQCLRKNPIIDSIYPFGEYLHITLKENDFTNFQQIESSISQFLANDGIKESIIKEIEPDIEDCFLKISAKNG